jgi:hypothetical protein
MELKLELICMLFAFMMCSTINFSLVLGPLDEDILHYYPLAKTQLVQLAQL